MTTRYLFRQGGLGDVLMALAACKALKARSDEQLVLVTSEQFVTLARACPHVDDVWATQQLDEIGRRTLAIADDLGLFHNLNPVSFGLAREHQVDAYLGSMGFEAPGWHKSVDLDIAPHVVDAVRGKLEAHGVRRGFIALHPAQADPNRSWPVEHWRQLAVELHDRGHCVVAIGSRGEKGAIDLQTPSIVSMVGALDLLETIALLRQADALVTTDGGPLHLAGATDVALVGLFSVVRGTNRLPYRHGELGWNAVALEPECPHFPCYRTLARPDVMKPLGRRIKAGDYSLNDLFSRWCLHDQPFACMNAGHRPADVLQALALLGLGTGVRAQTLPAISAIDVNASA